MSLLGPEMISSSSLGDVFGRYLRIVRPDHWIKNVLMVLGIVVALTAWVGRSLRKAALL